MKHPTLKLETSQDKKMLTQKSTLINNTSSRVFHINNLLINCKLNLLGDGDSLCFKAAVSLPLI